MPVGNNSRDKALWKRTRMAKKKGGTGGAPPSGPPKMTKDTARALLTKVLDTVKTPANKVGYIK